MDKPTYDIYCGGKDTEMRLYVDPSTFGWFRRWMVTLCIWIDCGSIGRIEFRPREDDNG